MNMSPPPDDFATHILIVDDDPDLRSLIAEFLDTHGYHTDSAADPQGMREMMEQRQYDLIILDVMMPREDGFSALRHLQHDVAPPVIMLSAAAGDIDRIIGLEMGAEDYLAKPCNPRELLARIRTVLRRRAGQTAAVGRSAMPGAAMSGAAGAMAPAGRLGFAGWTIDPLGRTLIDSQRQVVTLSDGEFRLMRIFVEHPRQVLSRDQLHEHAVDGAHYDRVIDVQVSRLRRKLAGHEGGEELIRTVHREGYMFVPVVQPL